MTPRPRVTAILNPHTGRRRAEELETLLRTTLERRFDVTVLRSRYPGDARELARRAATDSAIVIAVGGDGTVSDVASGILGSSAALGIIPTGSTNVIARSLGIPLNPNRAAQVFIRPSELRHLDVAINRDRATLHMGGVGLDAVMMRDAEQSLKRFALWLAYVPPGLRHLGRAGWDVRVSIDGQATRFRARMVLVANGSFVLIPVLKLGKDIRPDDGLLDVCVFTPPTFCATLTVMAWALLGQVWRSRYFWQASGRDIVVEADPPAPAELDGDYVGTTPLHLQVRPQAIPIVVPAGRAREHALDTISRDESAAISSG